MGDSTTTTAADPVTTAQFEEHNKVVVLMRTQLRDDKIQEQLVEMLTKSKTIKVIEVEDNGSHAAIELRLQKMWAEFVGMAIFVFVGCASAINNPQNETFDVLKIAFAFGFGIFVLACTIGHHSGGQMNCAVTFCLVLTGDVGPIQGALNLIAQLAGSVFAGFMLWAVYPTAMDKTGTLGSNVIGSGYEWYNALVGEIFMTFLLCYVILETAVNKAVHGKMFTAELAIGLAVFLAHTSLIAVDGCSINPTRSFGPAVVASFRYHAENESYQPRVNPEHIWHDHYVFWLGPLLGAAIAAAMARFWWHPGQWSREVDKIVDETPATPADPAVRQM